MRIILKAFALVLIMSSCKNTPKKDTSAQDSSEMNTTVRFEHDSANKKVSVYFGESLFTNYLYVEDYYKPVLHPLLTKVENLLLVGILSTLSQTSESIIHIMLVIG